MANIAVINCVGISEYAYTPLEGDTCALDMVLATAKNLPETEELILLVREGDELEGRAKEFTSRSCVPTPEGLFAALRDIVEENTGLNSVFYVYGDTPLIDPALALRMWNSHRRYHADFTFADAYPVGIAVEILRASTIPPLSRLAEGMTGPLGRDGVFEVVRKDINAFEIETEIPPLDLRLLRIRLTAENRKEFLLLKRAVDSNVRGAEGLLHYLNDNRKNLRTLPVYLSVQITAGCPQSCSYCPYPMVAGDVCKKDEYMPLVRFEELLKDFSDFAGGGYINLSPWGEPALHPEIGAVVEALLEYPGFTGVIETAGLGWDRGVLESLAKKADGRLIWIVSLDAHYAESYRTLRGTGFDEALDTAHYLLKLFPEHAYVQAVRVERNEEELELFYRYWKERTGNIIIQKYDYFSKRLEQRRIADISPLKRLPCKHLERDLVVLLQGDVPLCRDDIYGEHSLGNVFSDGFEAVWQRGEPCYLQHVNEEYPDICRDCDEYYTFNY